MDGRFRYWRNVFELYVGLGCLKICGCGRKQSILGRDVCKSEGFWIHWYSCAIGLKPSPNHTTQAILSEEEFLLGNPQLMSNPLKYSSVCINLPRTGEYKRGKYWYSVLDQWGELTSILYIYVDIERIHAVSERKAWAAAHQVAMRKDYLGIQDAARKRRPPYQIEGAWIGSIVRNNDKDIGIMVSKDIWANMKKIVLRFQAQVLENLEVDLCTNFIMSYRGTLGYGTQTYDHLTPYLKVLHLTIYDWIPIRDDDGRKVATARLKSEKVTEEELFLKISAYP